MSSEKSGIERWLQCPECGSENVLASVNVDWEISFHCEDCGISQYEDTGGDDE